MPRRVVELLIGSGRLARDYTEAHARRVSEVMSKDVVSVMPQDPLADVVGLMETRHVKRVPVVAGGRLVGIVSRADLVRALVHSPSQPAAQENTGDQQIRGRILAQIADQPWGPRASVDVQVKDGVAELYGSVTDERPLRVVAENMPGVKAVRDHLVWVDPISGLVIPAGGSTPGADDL